MKRISLVVVILSAVLLLPPILRSNAQYEVTGSLATTVSLPPTSLQDASSTPEDAAMAFVTNEAIKYGVNPHLADCIIFHESHWQANRIGDVGNVNGQSYGLWQIEVNQHPDVTISQAEDYVFSTDWSLEQIKEGHVQIWSTYSQKPYYCRDVPVML